MAAPTEPAPKFQLLKTVFSRLGAFVPRSAILFADGMLNYLYVGRWMKERGYRAPRLGGRRALYEHVAAVLTEPVSYLEFGVYQGDSMRAWSSLLSHPQTRLDGFDSFAGLPEDWGLYPKGTFDTGGQPPVMDDPRVQFHKGWFEETLPGFVASFEPAGPLVVHVDADLYSSTSLVLKELESRLIPGTVLIFDEFFDRHAELKAFEEFLNRTGRRAECLGTTRAMAQAAFRISS